VEGTKDMDKVKKKKEGGRVRIRILPKQAKDEGGQTGGGRFDVVESEGKKIKEKAGLI